jgi:hypothetical protein
MCVRAVSAAESSSGQEVIIQGDVTPDIPDFIVDTFKSVDKKHVYFLEVKRAQFGRVPPVAHRALQQPTHQLLLLLLLYVLCFAVHRKECAKRPSKARQRTACEVSHGGVAQRSATQRNEVRDGAAGRQNRALADKRGAE